MRPKENHALTIGEGVLFKERAEHPIVSVWPLSNIGTIIEACTASSMDMLA